MFYSERQDKIIELLKKRENASVHFLSKELYVSEPTIRRDLAQLEAEGKIKRTFGGAVLTDAIQHDVPFSLRIRDNTDAKDIIAEKASELLLDGMVIFLDASTTVSHLVKYIEKSENLTVITNNPMLPAQLAAFNIRTFLTGGELLGHSLALVGNHAENFVRNFNADAFFFSCRGVTADGTLTDMSVSETELRRAMMKQSKKNVLMVDDSKIGKKYMYNLCTVRELDAVVCNTEIPPQWKTKAE